MNIVQITPGAGGMYCGGCLRDNAAVAEWRRLGHAALMVPLYLPPRLDEPDQSADTPIFFSGINVFFEQHMPWFGRLPAGLRRLLAGRGLLRWAAGRAARTRPSDVGELTVSMVLGESGRQAAELEDLVRWLKTQPRPDVISLSNVLLVGFVRRLKAELGVPVVCTLQGEDTFLDALPPDVRARAWSLVGERAREVDALIAPSRYFADLMTRRLDLRPDRVHVVPNGISLEGYPSPGGSGRIRAPGEPPVVGFFGRMCREKGLDTAVDAFIALRLRGAAGPVRLKVGGGCGPSDELVVAEMKRRLTAAGLVDQVSFHPNLDRPDKIAFLRSLDVLSTPALYGEAFGLYVIEALAAGVPVVQPRHAAFPELVAGTGGGLIADPSPEALAVALESLLVDPARARALGEAGQRAVAERYSIHAMARGVLGVMERVAGRSRGAR